MYDKTTFLSGLTMGLIGKGNPTFEASDSFTKGYLVGAELRAKRRLPVAYLFNGVRLPEVPESEFPYAVAYSKHDSETGNTVAYLLLSSAQFYYQESGLLNTGLYPKTDGSAISYSYDWPDSNLVWSRNTEGDLTLTAGTRAMITTSSKIFWANYDIENYTDGGVYFAASEPEAMPTYNEETAEWETLFDGTYILTEENVGSGQGGGAHGRGYWFNVTTIGTGRVFLSGDVLRVTCNGVSITGVATAWLDATAPAKDNCYVGNYGIYDKSCPDDGGNVCAINVETRLCYAVRDLGTYEIKLERMVS